MRAFLFSLAVFMPALVPVAVSASALPAKSVAVKKAPAPKDVVSGTVSAIEATTLTVTTKGGAYAIDVTGATLAETADAPALTFADVRVGDAVVSTGPITAQSQVSRTVADASLRARTIFAGTVTGVMGTLISINLNGAKYDNHPVDLTNATITRRGAPALATDIKVGDHVSIIGTLDGAQINASVVRAGVVAKTVKKKT
ncbi:MAG: hypothetical protein RLZZ324_423, partial [Candidatus Parcubacteria bacterium]